MATPNKKLTAKQRRFVDEYMVDLNATQAAIRAGYSPQTAEQGAAQLLSNIKVSSAVEKAKENLAAKTQITVERVINGLLSEAESTGHRSSQSARVSAWGLLGKHLAMFTNKVDQKNTIEAGDSLTELMNKIDGKTRTK